MSYSNTEILAGVLVAACLLLLYCNYNKSNSDGLHGKKNLPGLHLRDGYSNLPKAGSFKAIEGYTVGRPNDDALSYTTRSSYFRENLADQGLNDKATRGTPASANVEPPQGNENRMLWMPDAEIPLNVYTRDGHISSHEFSPTDETFMYKNVFERNSNRVMSEGAGSLCGSAMRYVDYGGNMQPTRSITM